MDNTTIINTDVTSIVSNTYTENGQNSPFYRVFH